MWITTDKADPIPGVVVGKATTPRSYLVETEGGAVRRNRRHLNVVPSPVEQTEEQPVVPQQQDPEKMATQAVLVPHIKS